jgi:uncharacterized protein YndB with AHSA1/START domain
MTFADHSPYRFENEVLIDASPQRVFDIVANAEQQDRWFQDWVTHRWTSPEPHGVGATREVQLKVLSVKERFLVWEPGRRIAFTITAITLPLVRRMVEDMRFEPEGDRTRLRWTAHYAPTLLMRAVHPVARLVFGRMFAASTRGLADYAGRHPKGP